MSLELFQLLITQQNEDSAIPVSMTKIWKPVAKKTKRQEVREGCLTRRGCSILIINLFYLTYWLITYWTEQCLKEGERAPCSCHQIPGTQVGGDAFGCQDLTLREESASPDIVIVSIQTLPLQYLMSACLFSLIIQLIVIFSWNGRAAAGSIRFPSLWHSVAWAAHRTLEERRTRMLTC